MTYVRKWQARRNETVFDICYSGNRVAFVSWYSYSQGRQMEEWDRGALARMLLKLRRHKWEPQPVVWY